MTTQQRRLFEDQPIPWEEDDQSEGLVSTVVFAGGPAGQFDYLVPDNLADAVEPGRRVLVPLGRSNRAVTGYCVGVETRPLGPRPLKPLQGIVDSRRLLSPSLLRLTRWIAEYYLCDLGQVIEAVLPAGVRGQAGTRLTMRLAVAADAETRLREVRLPPKQAIVINTLRAAAEPLTSAQLAKAAECTQAPIRTLRKKGLIVARTERVQSRPAAEPAVVRQPNWKLNADQKLALDTILESVRSGDHRTVLIHGVTGSGKTEVYIRAIRQVIGFGRQAIVLVPEISLTPQTVRRFRSRFDHVAVLHSHLTDADRHWHWEQIATGRVEVVVGTRSAVFAPVPELGMIILDEEHENSFKQDSVPRYHARDVAIERTRGEGVPLVLGSATPSLESWYRGQTGQYTLVDMPRRVLDRPLPVVGTVDLRQQVASRHTRGAIHRQLHTAIHAALEEGGQVILLLNRRGFSTHIQCSACGAVVRCPNCEIALTHHRSEQIALCHYCDYRVPAPSQCPACGLAGIRYSGLGTQRLEAEVRARFPGVRCLRMDSDTMQRRGAHERALAAFRGGEVKILLGTQMIAKGLHFPNVTLVGVINADTALHLPDFRAAEKTFHLVTQVAGRTGRGDKGGRVLVQTFNPDHPAIRAAARHDYRAFVEEELPIRKLLSYPPLGAMIRLVVRGPVEAAAGEFAAHLAQGLAAELERLNAGARILGPAPAPFSKLRGKYRFQIQVQGPHGDRLRAAVRTVTADVKPPKDVQWIADVDPLDML